jgi:uncharacterized protein (DUF1501 family)
MSSDCNHCAEFGRAHLLRRGAAEAGRGLPRIEPGQPVPAGTGLTRRSLLLRGSAALLSVYGASKLGLNGLQEGIARAAGVTNPVLVSVFMEGGTDSLSLLAPTADSTYRALRPTLALDPGVGTSFTEDPRLNWHPSAAAFDALHRSGKLSLAPAIGYDAPNQSHFTSRHYWEVGTVAPTESTGWMGRLLDVMGTPDNPLQGLSLDGHLSPALASSQVPVAAINGSGYDISQEGVSGEIAELMYGSIGSLGQRALGSKDSGLIAAGSVASHAMRVKSELSPFSEKAITTPVAYPSKDFFPSSLASLAAMLAAGVPLQCVSIDAPGSYDTHDNQAAAFSSNLKLTADSLAAFQSDLEARGLADRVITLVWSEFGRRPQENGSAGTDHGAAGTAMVIGSRVRGQMIGEWPGLDRLDADENVRATADFRGLYSSIVEQWFGQDARTVIPEAGSFPQPELIG